MESSNNDSGGMPAISFIDHTCSRVYTAFTMKNVRSVHSVAQGATMKQTVGVTEARS